MKLALSIAIALAGLIYAIMKVYAPDLPFTLDQILQILVLLLGWLGVTVTEGVLRAWIVKRGPPEIAQLFRRNK